MLPPIQSYFVRVRGERVVVENLGSHEWVELDRLDEVGPQIARWAYAASDPEAEVRLQVPEWLGAAGGARGMSRCQSIDDSHG
jgi:hypothetical protein